MQLKDIVPLRLTAQQLVGPKSQSPAEAVKHLLAMQAQDYNGALWSIGLRTGCSKQAVEKAIKDKKIVRTWPMRGTLHFMHADDTRWMLSLLAPRATAAAKSRRINMLGLTDAIVAEAEAAMRQALKGGQSIVRGEVVKLLGTKVKNIEITNQHTQHLMRNFGERGVICFGPNEGKQPTFVLLDDWVPASKEKPRQEALGELANRYFTSHGPATLKDFSGWGMLTSSDAKQAIKTAEGDLAAAEIDGTPYYYQPGLQPASASDTLLLPGFDEYLLGYKDHSAVLAAKNANKIVPGNNGMFLPTIVKNGQVVGIWKRQVTAKDVKFSYEPFSKTSLNAAQAEKAYKLFLQN